MNLPTQLAINLIGVIFVIALALICLYLIFSFFCEFYGAPFVPTSRRNMREILQLANLKKGQRFIELGSGDGRISRFAAKQYGVLSTGVELNLLLVIYAKMLARLQRISHTRFLRQNMFKANLSQADVVFMFLLPKTMQKLESKLLRECKNNVLIISHGFQIPGFKRYLILTTPRPIFSTYYYRLKNH